MHKSATKCNETICKWCKNKHGASKIIDTFETYQALACAEALYASAEWGMGTIHLETDSAFLVHFVRSLSVSLLFFTLEPLNKTGCVHQLMQRLGLSPISRKSSPSASATKYWLWPSSWRCAVVTPPKFITNSKCPLCISPQSQNHCCDIHNVVGNQFQLLIVNKRDYIGSHTDQTLQYINMQQNNTLGPYHQASTA
jgi:hypothetical protein